MRRGCRSRHSCSTHVLHTFLYRPSTLTSTFDFRQAMVMTHDPFHTQAKYHGERPVASKASVETEDRRTDTTSRITFPANDYAMNRLCTVAVVYRVGRGLLYIVVRLRDGHCCRRSACVFALVHWVQLTDHARFYCSRSFHRSFPVSRPFPAVG